MESADRKNICQLPTENVPMSTQEKKSAFQIGFLNKLWRMKIYGIPKSLVIWVSPSKQLRGIEVESADRKKKNLLSYIDQKRANENSRKQTSYTNRLSKVKENEIYGILKP